MTIGPRLISALALTAIMGFLYWMVPNFEPATVGATTPDRIALFFTGLFALFWIYLVVQGYPICMDTSAPRARTISITSSPVYPRSQPYFGYFCTSWVFGGCRS